jgi:hypothetical protein
LNVPDAVRPDRMARIARDTGLLVVACVVAGAGSILAGQDANWDLRGYHLYVPWAWVNGRYGFDLAPAQLGSFHNPTPDLPFLAMVSADWPPRAIAFALAFPAGIAAFFLWQVARILLSDLEPRLRNFAIVAALAIGMTGSHGIAMLGSTMNEWPGAALVLAALWLIVRDLDRQALRLGTVGAAGLLTGLACGLKLTAATFAVGFAVALVARRPVAHALRDGFAFGVCVLVGLAVTAGPWMALMQDLYGSPLFPYFNQIFASPLWPAEPVLERRFGPRSAMQWVTLPFDLLRPPANYVSEQRYRDARFPAVATLALAATIAAAISRGRGGNDRGELTPAWRFVIVFFGVSLYVWAKVFSVSRYLLPLEVLTGVAIVALVARWPRHHRRVAAVVTTAALIVLTTRYPTWGRTTFGEHFVTVERPPIEPNALVLLTADAPMSWVLTRFPADARHVGIENSLMHRDNGLRRLAEAIVASHRGPIYQLTTPDRASPGGIARLGLVRGDEPCGEVRGNLSRHPLALCRLARVAR